MHVFRLFTVLFFMFASSLAWGQEKFERQYRSFTNQHLSTSMTNIGTGYGILSTQSNAELELEAMNILNLDTKGKENWSNSYRFNDSIAYAGEIIRLADGGLVFSTILDKDSLNKVITYVESGGTPIWHRLTGQLTDTKSLPFSRSTLTDIPEERILHAHTISDSIVTSQTVIQLSSYLYDGTEEFTRKWTGEGLGSISIQDMITTVDTSVLIIGQSESLVSPFFLAKLDKEGNLLWTRSYRNDFGRLEVNGGYRITELVDSSYVIMGSFAPDRTSARAGFVLNVQDNGEIIKGYRINGLNANEEIYPSNVVGLGDKSIVVSVKRLQSDASVMTSLVNFDLDSIVSYQTSLDTSVNDLITEGALVSVDSMSASFLTTSIHPLSRGLTPYIAKVDRAGTTFCEESIPVVSFDSLGWRITDTIDWVISDMEIFIDSTELEFASFAGFDPPNRVLQDTTYCPNVEINYLVDATIRGGIRYIWDDDNTDSIRIFTEEGTYSVTMTVREDICFNACDTVTISVAELPMVAIAQNKADFCETGQILLVAQPMGQIVSFLWNDGSTDQVRVVDEPGTYSVMVTDNCMEASMERIVLTDADFTVNTNIDIMKSNGALCTDGTIILTANGIDEIEGVTWSNGITNTQSIAVSEPGTYSLFKDGICTLSGEIVVTDDDFNVVPTVELNDACTNSQFVTITSSGTNNNLRRWSTDETTASIQVTEAGTYSVTVTGPCGDEVTESIDISENDINDCIVRPPGQDCLEFPNVFIPTDREELNKTFGPRIDCDVETYELHIYNRWGQDIWNTTNPDTRWDGNLDGNPAPGDVYFWWARYGDLNEEFQKEGDVTLIR